MNRVICIVACALLAVCLTGADSQPAGKEQPQRLPQGERGGDVLERGTMRAIRLPESPTEIPPGPGREVVVAQCAVCHSLSYLPLQPPLSRDQWTAVVTKMQKTFSAPIPDDQVPPILDYLVANYGTK